MFKLFIAVCLSFSLLISIPVAHSEELPKAFKNQKNRIENKGRQDRNSVDRAQQAENRRRNNTRVNNSDRTHGKNCDGKRHCSSSR